MRYSGTVIDLDIHNDWRSPEVIVDYLPPEWREGFAGHPRVAAASLSSPVHVLSPPPGPIRVDSFPADGSAPASDYQLMQDQLLGPFNIERAILRPPGFVPVIQNPYLAAAVATAVNDWSIDTWLARGDDRFYSGVIVGTHLPELAAEEIRRVGSHPRLVELMLSNSHNKPLGHPIYHPMYEAAAELDLVVGIHIGGHASGGLGISPIAAGIPSTYLEHHMLLPTGVISHLVSFIVHGVFEKYPSLRVQIIETGVAWLPWFLWRFDTEYKALRRETPWLRRLPSEYVREHVRFTTQPLELSPKREHLVEMLASVGAEDLMCFSSDYPHWDTDEVDHVASRFPKEWWPKIFRDNARVHYGFPDAPAVGAGVAAGAQAGVA